MKTISCILFIITLVTNSGGQMYGQEKVNLSAGIGFRDLLNLGCQYQVRQTQYGIGLGFWPEKGGYQISGSADIYYHFGYSHELSNLLPWYVQKPGALTTSGRS